MLKFKRATVGKHTKSPVKKKGGKSSFATSAIGDTITKTTDCIIRNIPFCNKLCISQKMGRFLAIYRGLMIGGFVR